MHPGQERECRLRLTTENSVYLTLRGCLYLELSMEYLYTRVDCGVAITTNDQITAKRDDHMVASLHLVIDCRVM